MTTFTKLNTLILATTFLISAEAFAMEGGEPAADAPKVAVKKKPSTKGENVASAQDSQGANNTTTTKKKQSKSKGFKALTQAINDSKGMKDNAAANSSSLQDKQKAAPAVASPAKKEKKDEVAAVASASKKEKKEKEKEKEKQKSKAEKAAKKEAQKAKKKADAARHELVKNAGKKEIKVSGNQILAKLSPQLQEKIRANKHVNTKKLGEVKEMKGSELVDFAIRVFVASELDLADATALANAIMDLGVEKGLDPVLFGKDPAPAAVVAPADKANAKK